LLVLKHNDVVWGAKFSKDEKEIISWTKDGVVKTDIIVVFFRDF
jgi:hypothetical protein